MADVRDLTITMLAETLKKIACIPDEMRSLAVLLLEPLILYLGGGT